MITAFDIGRNDPCPCGSGRKYKKCCQPAVEEVAGKLRRDRPWMHHQMALALGLMAGLRPDEEDQAVPIEELVAALERMETDLMAEEDDDDAWAEVATRYTHVFNDLQEAELFDLRFSPEEIGEFLNWVEDDLEGVEIDMDPESEEFMNAFQGYVNRYLPGLVNAARREELAWRIIWAMRGTPHSIEQNVAMLFALWQCLEDAEINPIWQMVFLASVSEVE